LGPVGNASEGEREVKRVERMEEDLKEVIYLRVDQLVERGAMEVEGVVLEEGGVEAVDCRIMEERRKAVLVRRVMDESVRGSRGSVAQKGRGEGKKWVP
jgi:hypothetical protein